MKIVVDTNVLISGIFFGGFPRAVIEGIVNKTVEASASIEIIKEYEEIVHEMISRKQGHLSEDVLSLFVQSLEIIVPQSSISVCRDSADNKFLECAVDSKAMLVVSGDKDLLVLKKIDDIEIVTAKEFVEKYIHK